MPGLQLVIELDDKGAINKVITLDGEFGKFTGGMGAKAAKAASAMKKIESASHSVSSALQKLSMVGGVSLGVLSGRMFYAGVQFEQSMANVKAASGATASELKELEGVARQYALTTVFSATQIGNAMRSLAKEGMAVGEIKDVIGKALLFAGATGMELEGTIVTLTDTLDAFGMAASEAGDLVGLLTGAMSVTPIDALMAALGRVGPVAAPLGITIKDLIVDFTLLEREGIAGTRAGSGFGIMLGMLLSPSAEVAALLGNVTFNGKNLREVLDKLRDSGASATDILSAFGTRGAGPVLNGLLKSTAGSIGEVEAALNDTSAATTALEDRMATTKAQMAMFKNAIDEYLIQAFEAIKKPFADGMEALKAAFKDALPSIIEQVKKLGEWISSHKDLIADMIAGLPKMLLWVVGLKLLADGIGGVITVVNVLKPAMMLLWSNPVILGIATLVIAIASIATEMDKSIDKAMTLKKTLADMPHPREEGLIVPLASGPGLLSPYAPSGVAPAQAEATATGGGGGGAKSGVATDWGELSRQAEEDAAFRRSLSAGVRDDAITNAAKTASASKAFYLDTINANTAADNAWLSAKIGLAAMERDAVLAGAAEMAQARIDYDNAVKEAELAHNEAVWQDWLTKNQGMVMMMQGLEAGWDTMVNSALDKEMTGKQRREAMWESMKQSFLKSTSDMLKKELILKVKNWLLAEGLRKPFTLRERFDAAKVGAVKAYSAFAGIPVIGPVLGAIAAAAAFAFLIAFHKGGFVGANGSQEQIVRVIPGEFVMQPQAVRNIGRENMEYMNATGRIPAQSRGSIASGRVSASGGGASIGPFVFQISGASKESANDLIGFIEEKIVPMLESAVSRRKFSLKGEM